MEAPSIPATFPAVDGALVGGLSFLQSIRQCLSVAQPAYSAGKIGLIFSTVQVVQFFLGIVTPMIFRALGLVNGIVATQIATAVALACMAGAADGRLAVALYLCFSAAQWMSAPGLYNLLMNETPDTERSTAAAMTMFCNALAGSAATAGAGILFTRFGYPPVLMGIAALALGVAILFRLTNTPRPVDMSVPS